METFAPRGNIHGQILPQFVLGHVPQKGGQKGFARIVWLKLSFQDFPYLDSFHSLNQSIRIGISMSCGSDNSSFQLAGGAANRNSGLSGAEEIPPDIPLYARN